MADSAPQGSSPDPRRKRALVVLGMHRSGTSAMARVLSLSGAALPSALMQPEPDNPAGFWESWTITEFNSAILEAADSAWDDIFVAPATLARGIGLKQQSRARTLLHDNFGQAEVVVMKDPRTSVLVALWEEALRGEGYEPFYIVMVRNPLEVAQSLRVRNDFSRQKSLLLWTSYMLAAERATRGAGRAFVAYDELMGSAQRVLDRIEAASGWLLQRRTSASALEIEQFLTEDLRHHRLASSDLQDRPDVWEPVRQVYAWMRDAALDLDPPVDQLAPAQARLRDAKEALGVVFEEVQQAKARFAERCEAIQAREVELAGRVGEQGLKLTTLMGALEQAAIERERLQTEATLFQEQLVSREAECETAHRTLQAQESQAANERAHHEQATRVLHEELTHIQAVAQGLQDAFSSNEAAASQLAAENAGLRADLAKLGLERDRLQLEVTATEAPERADPERGGRDELAAARLEADHARQALEHAKADFAAQQVEHEAAMAAERERVAAVQAQADTHQGEIERLQSALEQTASDAELEAQRQAQATSELQDGVAAWRNQALEAEARIEQLQEGLRSAEREAALHREGRRSDAELTRDSHVQALQGLGTFFDEQLSDAALAIADRMIKAGRTASSGAQRTETSLQITELGRRVGPEANTMLQIEEATLGCGVLRLQGWALGKPGLKRVRLFDGARQVAEAAADMPRPDVGALHPQFGMTAGGFVTSWPLAELPQPYVIAAVLLSGDDIVADATFTLSLGQPDSVREAVRES